VPAAALLLLAATHLPVAAQTGSAAVPKLFEIPDDPRVEHYARRYRSTNWRPWMLRMIDLSGFYGGYVLAEIERRGMPPELLFLPAIESAYASDATSWAGAAGLWQLMPATARLYGLAINELIDERLDFWKATDVALRILDRNYAELGSWELALAAYNAGLGRIRRVVRAAGSGDYWELSRRGLLPRETREFVPRFYGFLRAVRTFPGALPPVDSMTQWRQLEVPAGIELGLLGTLAEVPLILLERANAELVYGLTPPAPRSEPYRLKVPAHTYDRFTEVLEDADGVLVRLHWHVIRSGDTISELAEAFQVNVGMIRQFNRGVDPRKLRVGNGLLIPLMNGVDPGTAAAPHAEERPFEGRYRVARGDSLWLIARRFDTTVEALAAANRLRPNGTLHPGQMLQVPVRALAYPAAGYGADGVGRA
jgi:membrane-bound lytic murein transglycosylase D